MTTGKRILKVVFCIAFALVFTMAFLPFQIAYAATNTKVIVIDPGHQYKSGSTAVDAGAIGLDGTTEASLTKIYSDKLARALQSNGYTVYTTFDVGDPNVPHLVSPGVTLEGRADASRAKDPDLFIAIHFNSDPAAVVPPCSPVKGTAASGEEVLYESNQINQLAEPRSLDLANHIYSAVSSLSSYNMIGNRSTGSRVIDQGADVLYYNTAPAVTLEAGFLTNSGDLNNLKKNADAIVGKITDGIYNYEADNPQKLTMDKTAPTIETVRFGASNPTASTGFAIAATGVADTNKIWKVQFSVTNQTTGATKIYTGTDHGGGYYDAFFTTSDFGNSYATYVINAYAYDIYQNKSEVKSTSVKVATDITPPTIQSVAVGASNPTASTGFAIAANGVTDNAAVARVEFDVTNQTTGATKAYAGNNHGGGYYDAFFTISDFGNSYATYTIDAYAWDTSGLKSAKISKSITVAKDTTPPTIQTVAPGVSSPTVSTGFAINATGVTDNAAVARVEFDITNQATGVTKAYAGTNHGGGSYGAFFSISDFGNSYAAYTIDAYAWDTSGLKSAKVTNSITVVKDTTPPTIQSVAVGASNPTASTGFAIAATGVTDNAAVARVEFDVTNQKTGATKAYAGFNHGGGYYDAFLSIADFGYSYATYTIDAYAWDTAGLKSVKVSRSITVAGDTTPPTIQSVAIGASNPTTSTGFAIAATGVTDNTAVARVEFDVTNQTTGATKAYAGFNHGGGYYDAFLSIADFGNSYGTYTIDAYAWDTSSLKSAKVSRSISVAATPILGTPQVTENQMINYFISSAKNRSYDPTVLHGGVNANTGFPNYYGITLQQFADIYWSEATSEGIRPEVAFAQMCNETGFLRFGGQVSITQYNFAGIGALDGGGAGADFYSQGIRIGIRAQIQHLFAYATATGNPKNLIVDPRFGYVTRGCAPYVELLGGAGKWASDYGYGSDLDAKLAAIRASSTTIAQ